MSDPILSRSFKHMQWANRQLFLQLSDLPESALSYSAWNPEWTVATIAHHIFIAAGRLQSRITQESAPEELAAPTTSIQMRELAQKSFERDEKFLALLNTPDELRKFVRFGKEVEFHTSTILAQATHHASEHRGQIADILAVNKMDVVNLDTLDLWSFERFERKNRE